MDYAAYKSDAQPVRLPRAASCMLLAVTQQGEPRSERSMHLTQTAALLARLMPRPELMIARRTASRGESAKRLPPKVIWRFRAPECARLRKNYRQFS
jgi:hypothetical protein